MTIWAPFLCVAVAVIAAAEGHVIPVEPSEQLWTPLVGSAEEGEKVLVEENGTVMNHPWYQIGDRLFAYVPVPRTWIEAERYCISKRGNLASVHSIKEYFDIQDMIRELIHDFPETWLGGHDAVQDGKWLWSDGTGWVKDAPLPYWATNQPDNSGDCVIMNAGGSPRWDDRPCSSVLPSVCAIRI